MNTSAGAVSSTSTGSMPSISRSHRTGSTSSGNSRRSNTQSQRDLQRRIFLNTMRNVYPNSLLIRYEYSEDEGQFVMQPASVTTLCPAIKDKLWAHLLVELNNIFIDHVQRRQQSMLMAWLGMIFAFTAYFIVGLVTEATGKVAYQVTGPIVAFILVVFLPNIIYSRSSVRPLLRRFDQWKQNLALQLDKEGIEVVKVTTGEIVSDRSPYRVLGTLYFGSTAWFRFEDAQVEIFWRSVKSGKSVRRYSLMISSSAAGVDADEEEPVRKDAALKDEAEEDDDADVEASHDTLASI